MTEGLADAVDRFIDDLSGPLVELAAVAPTVRPDKLRGDVAVEAYDIAAAMLDADGLHTDNELLAMIDSFADRLPAHLLRGTPGEIRTAGLFTNRRHWIDQPSALFQLLVAGDTKNGSRHGWTYYERAMAIAHEVCGTDAHVSHLELAALERLRSTLLAPLQRLPTPQPATPSPGDATALPPARTLVDLHAELDALVGLDPVKAEIKLVADLLTVQNMRRERGLPVVETSRHLVFTGNPGTGKTTIARLLAELYRTLGVVSKGQLIETDRAGLVAGFVGQTATKVDAVVTAALGGLLLVDEAYSLARGDDRDFGQEAIDALVKRMEDHRDDLVVIVAGYPAEMTVFIESNPGLRSRFPKRIHFPDYTDDELVAIFVSICERNHYRADREALAAVRARLAQVPRGKGFGNGRVVRNLFEASLATHASRVVAIEDVTDEQLSTLTSADIAAAAEPEAAVSPVPALRAATAPIAIVGAGAGVAAAVLTGLPVVAMVGIGVIGLGIGAGIGRLRRPRPDRIDPFTLSASWRRPVHGGLKAQRRFHEAVDRARPGPLRERLAEIGDRIDAGVREAYRIAQRGDEMEDGLAVLDVERTRRALAAEDHPEARASLEAKLASAQRVLDAIADARERLRLLEARLDESVSRAVELSLRSTDDGTASTLGTDVETLVGDLEALRAALEDVDRPGGAT